MARNRVIYAAEALYAGPSPGTGTHYYNENFRGGLSLSATPYTGSLIRELHRIQSANYSYNIPHTDVNQYGELAAIDRIILEQPTVSLDFSFLAANLQNETNCGFTMSDNGTWISCISGILSKSEDERNYFIRTVDEGADAYADPDFYNHADGRTIGIGNGFISSYSAEGSIGNFPTVSMNVEALNMEFETILSGAVIPSVNPEDGTASTKIYEIPVGISSPTGVLPAYGTDLSANSSYSISALRPGDITVTIYDQGQTSTTYNDGGPLITDWKLQSYNFNFDLSREPLQKLGSKYAFSREVNFPLTASTSLTADLGDLEAGSLITLINNDAAYDIVININEPGTSTTSIQYQLRNAKLDSQEYTSSVGSNKSVSLNFATQIGGPNQTSVGAFMSGTHNIDNSTRGKKSEWVNATY